MSIISTTTYPAIFTAMRHIDLSNGRINRLEPARDEIEVPVDEQSLVEIEGALSQLTPDELEAFADGDEAVDMADCVDPGFMRNWYYVADDGSFQPVTIGRPQTWGGGWVLLRVSRYHGGRAMRWSSNLY